MPGIVPTGGEPRVSPGEQSKPSAAPKASPWLKIDEFETLADFDLPPDVNRVFQTFTDALGTHVPRAMTRTQSIGRAMHAAVK